jgi:hypothetical protein
MAVHCFRFQDLIVVLLLMKEFKIEIIYLITLNTVLSLCHGIYPSSSFQVTFSYV